MPKELSYQEKQKIKDKVLYLDHPFVYNGKKIDTMYKLQKIVKSLEILNELSDKLSDLDCACINRWWFFKKDYIETDEIIKNNEDFKQRMYDRVKDYF